MTDSELHDAIAADATAKSLADSGADAACAARMAATLPPFLASTYVNERGVFAAVPDPAAAEAFLQGLTSAATGNPVLARALSWMAPDQGGIDVSFASVRALLDQLVTAGTLDATTTATVKALAQRPTSVATDAVSRAWARYRPDGKVVL